MNDASLARTLSDFLEGEELTRSGLDALLEFHEDLIYNLKMFGDLYLSTVQDLRSKQLELEEILAEKDGFSHIPLSLRPDRGIVLASS